MASSLNALLNIGNGALFASQTALQTTGNNVANVNTVGYSRQSVRFESYPALDYFPGQMGQGVQAVEVMRHFDKFVERNYLNKFSEQNRWTAMSQQMGSVESIFNETTGLGINKLMQEFYAAWEKLSQFPDDLAAREALIGKSQSLSDAIRSAGTSVGSIYDRVDGMVSQQVDQANSLMEQIAELNRQINMHSVPGKNNPNTLMDQRDQKVRELAALIDIDVIDKGQGNYIVNTKAGHTLVDGVSSFKLSYNGPTYFKNPTPTNVFDGGLNFSGTDGYEYTLEFVQGGTLGDDDAKFKVSLDGGKTWVVDDTGQPKLFTAREAGNDVQVKDLSISFTHGTNDTFTEGDRFTIVPKNALYWEQPTGGPMLISPQVFGDGTDNNKRVIGGSIGGNLIFRDYQLGDTTDQLDQFAKSLIWEVNRLHSQGAGLEHLKTVLGDYSVSDPNIKFSDDNNGLAWKDKLQQGNFTLTLYDETTGKPIMKDPGSQVALDVNFDPNTDTLQTLVNKINGLMVERVDANGNPLPAVPLSTFMEASISADNRLQINAKSGYSFGVGNDTSGIMAALGINTYFSGTGAYDMAVKTDVVQNHNLVNAGHINGAAEANAGDSQTARDIAALVNTKVDYIGWNGKKSQQTIGNFYGTLVAGVGSKSAAATFQRQASTVVANELEDRQSEISGVNLDEEMSNLIKFQASYKAAAKLITTADQMLQTVLSLKQ